VPFKRVLRIEVLNMKGVDAVCEKIRKLNKNDFGRKLFKKLYLSNFSNLEILFFNILIIFEYATRFA